MCPSVTGDLSGVVFYAGDVDRLARFYAAVLGLAVVDRADGYAVLNGGGGDVSIVAVPPAVAATLRLQEPPEIREETPVKPSFRVPSLAAAAAAALEHGGGTKPLDTAWDFRGLRHLDGFDPEGNVVQLVEPLDPGSAS